MSSAHTSRRRRIPISYFGFTNYWIFEKMIEIRMHVQRLLFDVAERHFAKANALGSPY
jgi:hypothetical protein